jgi:hypothetical protein
VRDKDFPFRRWSWPDNEIELRQESSVAVAWTMGDRRQSMKTYADAKGYINVRALTCAQLAGTFQEDANFLGVWYAGWFNGRAKLHSINIARTEDGIHHVIEYCKANPDKKVTEAIEVLLKGGK